MTMTTTASDHRDQMSRALALSLAHQLDRVYDAATAAVADGETDWPAVAEAALAEAAELAETYRQRLAELRGSGDQDQLDLTS